MSSAPAVPSSSTASPPDAPAFGFSEQLEAGRGSENYNRWIADQFMPYAGRRVLEVGCGIGNLARYWVDREHFLGIDTEPECVSKCTERFRAHPQARFTQDRVGAPGWVERWGEHRFDTVVAVNVLEHIRDDREALRGWRDIVRRGGGGHVCVFVPAFEFAFSWFDRRYGHYRRYTKETLRDRLLDAGMDIEELRYFNMPGLAAWWATFVLLGRKDTIRGQVGLYDRVVVPLARRLESRLTPPFGNSVVAVCKVAG
jgi:SAM-dependent methyltransferase